MLIINADDWGRSAAETDAALEAYEKGRITSVSAMVFMADSERAAKIALERGIPTGLHINLNEHFSGPDPQEHLRSNHDRIVRFLNRSRYSQILYSPSLRKIFPAVFQAQLDEFNRLYKKPPSHFDGHQHMHLCTNMLVASPIQAGQKVRRGFSFQRGEKGLFNRAYRALVTRRLRARYRTTDYFFALSQHLPAHRISRICTLALQANVELMTHPVVPSEHAYLHSEHFALALREVPKGSYIDL